jgi:serine phosphatase RsbU (regulator of sigma subunit)
MRWAQAGHPAPLLARAGRTEELPRPAGPLLGAVESATYATAEVRLRPGDLLVLYTDGLVEHRERSLAEGLAPVIAALDEVSAGAGPEPLADLLSRLRRANPGDDTCVLAAQVTPG